jgi:hypothetical protein
MLVVSAGAQPTYVKDGRHFLDLSKHEEGDVRREKATGEEWENYRTTKPLKPVHVGEY